MLRHNTRLLRRAALQAFLSAIALALCADLRGAEKTLLLIGQGPDGHPRGTHEYVEGLRLLGEAIDKTPGVTVRRVKADGPWPEGPEQIAVADGVVLFLAEGAKWAVADPRRHEALVRLAQRGGGLAALHWALGTKSAEPIEPFLKLLGGCHGGPDRKYQVLETDLHRVDPTHPITSGLADFRAHDEFYYRLKFTSDAGLQPLVQAMIEGERHTVAWCWQRPDGGRSFGFTGLHFHDNWQRPEYRSLVRQGVLWTLGVEAQAKAP